MNRTKIEYLEFTWNPAVGCFGEGCEVRRRDVCWAEKQAKRQKHRCQLCYEFRPHLHEERLRQPLKRKKPSKIGVCFSSDLFGLEAGMTNLILHTIKEAYWHTFVALTKQARNLENYSYPANLWLGVSVNTWADVWRIYCLRGTNAKVKFVSFEPLYENIQCKLNDINWIILGAQTRPYFQPNLEWVIDILNEAEKHTIPYFLKNNLGFHQLFEEHIRAYGSYQFFPNYETKEKRG